MVVCFVACLFGAAPRQGDRKLEEVGSPNVEPCRRPQAPGNISCASCRKLILGVECPRP